MSNSSSAKVKRRRVRLRRVFSRFLRFYGLTLVLGTSAEDSSDVIDISFSKFDQVGAHIMWQPLIGRAVGLYYTGSSSEKPSCGMLVSDDAHFFFFF